MPQHSIDLNWRHLNCNMYKYSKATLLRSFDLELCPSLTHSTIHLAYCRTTSYSLIHNWRCSIVFLLCYNAAGHGTSDRWPRNLRTLATEPQTTGHGTSERWPRNLRPLATEPQNAGHGTSDHWPRNLRTLASMGSHPAIVCLK